MHALGQLYCQVPSTIVKVPVNRLGAVGTHQGAVNDCFDRQGAVAEPVVEMRLATAEKALVVRGVDRVGHQSRCNGSSYKPHNRLKRLSL
jgi:hypothetical protein